MGHSLYREWPMSNQRNVYLIKDLARLSGHSVYTLKYYLKLGLIKEIGRSPTTRFRYFDEDTLAQLATIRSWRKEEKSLAEIHQLLTRAPSMAHAGARA